MAEGPLVLVDARNVLRSRWPNIPEDELVERCRAWAAARGARAVVVFDGRAPEGLVGDRELDERCRLVGTGAESADEWLIRTAAELRARQEPFWLVTSDRALRAAAKGAERGVGGGSFAGELLSL
jgi:predicted RNA-binding protein with PIN domain